MKLLLSFIFSLFFFTAFNQNINGTIKNAETGLVIFGANVIVKHSNPTIGVSSNIKGNFSLKNLKTGNYTLEISHLSYETATIEHIEPNTTKDLFLEITLIEKVLSSSTVEVKAYRNKETINEMATVSTHSISALERSHIAGGISDPSRLVLSLPGIKAQGDLNNGISIRGNKPTNMLWQLEGIEIQDPNHFTLGSTFGGSYVNGAVNAISNNLLNNINLYTGAFPAEYGNALAGVMDLNLRNGNEKNFEYNLNIGMLGLEASAEGPIEMGGSFLLSFRYSTLDLASAIGFDVSDSKIGYRDLNYKINLPTKKLGTFSAFGVAGWSDSKSLDYYRDKRVWTSTYNNAVFGLTHKISLSKKTYLKSVAALSKVKTSYHFYNLGQGQNNKSKEYYNRNETTFRFNVRLYNSINTKNKLVSGIKISHPKLKFRQGTVLEEPIFEIDPYKDVSFNNSTVYLQAFSQWKHKFNNKLSVNTGLHFMLFTYNMNYSVEPRLSLKYAFHKKHTLNFASGIHSQIEFLPIYMAEVITFYNDPFETNYNKENLNKNLELSKAFHITTNYEYKPFKDFNIKLEAYVQYHFDVPELVWTRYKYGYDTINQQSIVVDSIQLASTTQNSSSELLNYNLENNGTGLNYGFELSVMKNFNRNYSFSMTGSLFRAFYKTSLDKTWQPTVFDGLFTFSVAGSKDFKIGKQKQNILSLSSRFLWSGGYIRPNLIHETGVNRFSNYYKLDTKIAYTLIKSKFEFKVALDILNTTNHKNESVEYTQNASGILPVLSFNVKFQK